MPGVHCSFVFLVCIDIDTYLVRQTRLSNHWKKQTFHFLLSGFSFTQDSQITRHCYKTATSSDSCLPLPLSSQRLRHDLVLTLDSSPLHIASGWPWTGNFWFLSASCKPLNYMAWTSCTKNELQPEYHSIKKKIVKDLASVSIFSLEQIIFLAIKGYDCKSKLLSRLNVRGRFSQNGCNIWHLVDCNRIWTQQPLSLQSNTEPFCQTSQFD